MNQTAIFERSEGDAWYERNKTALHAFDAASDLPLRVISRYGLTPGTVIEVGASTGYRLQAIAERTGARAVAVEPSRKAIEEGMRRHPRVQFLEGSAHAVPVAESFDLVITHFVLHWVDRALLFASMAELDRLTADGGYLLIGDFMPAVPTRVPYHHLPGQGVFTYKQDYAAPFLQSGLYHIVATVTADHADTKLLRPAVPEASRAGVWLLRKDLHGHYADQR